MTARQPQHSVYIVPEHAREHRNGCSRQVRAVRHRQVKRLLAPTPWRRRAEYAVVGLIAGVIGIVAAAGVLAGLFFFWKTIDSIFRAATGGN
jgi:hypothetical protein